MLAHTSPSLKWGSHVQKMVKATSVTLPKSDPFKDFYPLLVLLMNFTVFCPFCYTKLHLVPDQLRIASGWVCCGKCNKNFEATHYPNTKQDETAITQFIQNLKNRQLSKSLSNQNDLGFKIALPKNSIGVNLQVPKILPYQGEVLGNKHPSANDLAFSEQSIETNTRTVSIAKAPSEDLSGSDFFPRNKTFEPSFEPPLITINDSEPPLETTSPLQSPIEHFSDSNLLDKTNFHNFVVESKAEHAPQKPSTYDEPEYVSLKDLQEPPLSKKNKSHLFLKCIVWFIIMTLVIILLVISTTFVLRNRNRLAEQFPAARHPLELICKPLGCDITPIKQIKNFAIESSTLVKNPNNTLQFNFTLANLASYPLASPSLNLNLVDNKGVSIYKGIFSPKDLGLISGFIGSYGQLKITLTLPMLTESQLSNVQSYHMGIFYPQ